MKSRYKEVLDKIPKSIKYQISGYEIFEIPREAGDTKEGFVSVVLCNGHNSDSIDMVRNAIEKERRL